MKKMKKFLALLLTLTMLLSLGGVLPAAAEEGDTKTYAVLGVDQGLTVTAYQIIKLNDDKTAFVPVISNTIDTVGGKLNPTSDNIQKLAGMLSKLSTSIVTTDYRIDRYIYENLTPGTWMIIVTGDSDYFYNPAIISVKADDEELNLDVDEWAYSTFVKKSEPKITKKALSKDANSIQYSDPYADDTTDQIQYQIIADIPDYTDTDVDNGVTYTITDTLTGMKYKYDADEYPVSVSVFTDSNNNAVIDNGESTDLTGDVADLFTNAVSTAATNGTTTFTVDLSVDPDDSSDIATALKTFLKDNHHKKIVLTYYAEPTIPDDINHVDEFTNKASFTYSANGNNDNTKDSEITYHYSFGLDNEFIKIDDSSKVSYNNDGTVSVTEEKDETVSRSPLAGAEFAVYIVDENSPETLFLEKVTTDEYGRLPIHGLDSDITYRLIETKAPEFYTKNENPVTISIKANYDEATGILEDYAITLAYNNQDYTTHYTYNHTDKTAAFDTTKTNQPLGFVNTTFGDLPSTGGMGTTLFTIGGCILMILAAAIFFMSRRKDSE